MTRHELLDQARVLRAKLNDLAETANVGGFARAIREASNIADSENLILLLPVLESVLGER